MFTFLVYDDSSTKAKFGSTIIRGSSVGLYHDMPPPTSIGWMRGELFKWWWSFIGEQTKIRFGFDAWFAVGGTICALLLPNNPR